MPFWVRQVTAKGVKDVSWHYEQRKAIAACERVLKDKATLDAFVVRKNARGDEGIVMRRHVAHRSRLVREIVKGKLRLNRRGF